MEPTGPVIKAALALAALANSCNNVEGEPHCAELEALKATGWKFTFFFDAQNAKFYLTGSQK